MIEDVGRGGGRPTPGPTDDLVRGGAPGPGAEPRGRQVVREGDRRGPRAPATVTPRPTPCSRWTARGCGSAGPIWPPTPSEALAIYDELGDLGRQGRGAQQPRRLRVLPGGLGRGRLPLRPGARCPAGHRKRRRCGHRDHQHRRDPRRPGPLRGRSAPAHRRPPRPAGGQLSLRHRLRHHVARPARRPGPARSRRPTSTSSRPVRSSTTSASTSTPPRWTRWWPSAWCWRDGARRHSSWPRRLVDGMEEQGSPRGVALVQRVRGYALLQGGDLDGARAAFEASRESAAGAEGRLRARPHAGRPGQAGRTDR